MMTQKRKLDDVSHVSISNPKETISRSKTSVVTDEDFDIALDLLRRPPTPDDTKFFNDRPQVDISPAPVNRFSVTSPIQIIQTKNENNNQIRSTIQEEQQVHFSLSRANSLVGGPIENEPVTPERRFAAPIFMMMDNPFYVRYEETPWKLNGKMVNKRH